MLQRNDNPDSDDEIADNNTQTEMIIEKKKRPPKTQAQLDALAKGRQKMIENKSVRDQVKKENTEVIETVKTKLKKKDQRETIIQNVVEPKVALLEPKHQLPLVKKEPRIVVEEEEPEVIIVRKPRKRIIVERSDTEEEEEVIVKPKKVTRKKLAKQVVEEEEEEEEIVKPQRKQVQQQQPVQQPVPVRPALKINFF